MSSKKIEKKPKEKVYSKNSEKAQKELLKEAVSLTVGKQARDIVDFIEDRKHINEFLIAKKLDITINQTRNILYKLSDYGFVSSIRKKDKRKGWYTYFWKIESIKALEFLKNHSEKRLGQIVNQIENRESKTFYVCNTCNVEFNEENALLYDFTCNECGAVFKIKENTKLLRELKKNHERQKNELALIEKEIQEERENIEKRKEREFKKEAKKKAEIALKKKKSVKSKSKLIKKPKKEKTKKVTKKKPIKTKKPSVKSKTKKKITGSKAKPVKKIKKKAKAKKK